MDYYNTVIMANNALHVFDMAEQIALDPGKRIDEQAAVDDVGLQISFFSSRL